MRCSILLLTSLLLVGLLAGCNNLTDLDAITRRSTEDVGVEDESASGGSDVDLANNNRVPSEDTGEASDASPTDAAPGEDVDLPDVSEGEEVGEEVGMDTAPDADPPDVEMPPVCTAADLDVCDAPRCMIVTGCDGGRCVYEPSASCTARGEVCERGRECVVGACGDDGWCGGAGGPCTSSASCMDGLECMEGMCSPPPPPVQISGMVFVPTGASLQGEGGALRVFVSSFYIDRTEVTVAAYGACVDAGGCSAPSTEPSAAGGCRVDIPAFAVRNNWHNRASRGMHPVNCVDWNQAAAYCAWVEKRLPTEAEWEKAARGTDGRTYPWGEAEPTCELAVFDDGTGPGCGTGTTAVVGSRSGGASPYGVVDMSGNVLEWTQDWYEILREVDGLRDPEGPVGPVPGAQRVHRWGIPVALHSGVPADYSGDFLGFRCVRSAP